MWNPKSVKESHHENEAKKDESKAIEHNMKSNNVNSVKEISSTMKKLDVVDKAKEEFKTVKPNFDLYTRKEYMFSIIEHKPVVEESHICLKEIQSVEDKEAVFIKSKMPKKTRRILKLVFQPQESKFLKKGM